MYAIIDIETTGGNSKTDRITEIAIFLHDGTSIIDEFKTLINPERRIPFFITELTGIDDDLVADAPKFYEVAKHIVEITKDAVFVAHNVNFDYNFIKQEFKSLGYTFSTPKLCTVKLSRAIFKGFESYSLGKLCNSLGIPLSHRHRAEGDAKATVLLFEMLLAKDKNNLINPGIGTNAMLPAVLNSNLKQSDIDRLPNVTGIYYFYDKNDVLIYIGKSKHIRSRILSHLNNAGNRKAIEMRNEIATIDYTITGSELISMLLESAEIKKHKPFYNRKSLKSGGKYGLFSEFLLDGFVHLKIAKLKKDHQPMVVFSDIKQAKGFLQKLSNENDLCPKICGIDHSNGPCSNHLNLNCNGECYKPSCRDSHNKRLQIAVQSFDYDYRNFIIIDEGREKEEQAVIKIENSTYKGYCYIDKITDNLLPDHVNIGKLTKNQTSNWEVQQIIHYYLRKNKHITVVPF